MAAALLVALPWWQRWLLRWIAKRLLKAINKAGRGYLSRMRAFEFRQAIIAEIAKLNDWARQKTPELTVDDDACQFAAWIMESDTLQGEVNERTGAKRDVHARWGSSGVIGDHVP
jgi:hypothetical protein